MRRSGTRRKHASSGISCPKFLSVLYGATDLFRISNDSRSSIVAKFRAGFILHSSLKIEREISHTFEIQNFPQAKYSHREPPPPPLYQNTRILCTLHFTATATGMHGMHRLRAI